jgi:hypothetical protein
VLGRRVATVAPARTRVATSSRPLSVSAAPLALSLLPSVPSLSEPARGFGARDAFLLADVLFGLILLGLASLPPRALASPRLAAVVATRRMELAVAGAATIVVAVVTAFRAGS